MPVPHASHFSRKDRVSPEVTAKVNVTTLDIDTPRPAYLVENRAIKVNNRARAIECKCSMIPLVARLRIWKCGVLTRRVGIAACRRVVQSTIRWSVVSWQQAQIPVLSITMALLNASSKQPIRSTDVACKLARRPPVPEHGRESSGPRWAQSRVADIDRC